MLCPKCGQEYEGSKCPICDKPDVLVNHEDYLRRRRAYEEKQAVIKSASSGNEEKDDKAEEGLRPEEMLGRLVDVGEHLKQGIADKLSVKKNRVKKICAVLMISLLLLAAVIFGIFQLNLHKKSFLYTVADNKIYTISEEDNIFACEQNEVFFDAAQKSFYKADLPKELNGMAVTDRIASQQGKYFCASVYDEKNNQYCIYIWDNKNIYKFAENAKAKKLLYIDEAGNVVYQDTEVINEEGSVGNTALYIGSFGGDKNVVTAMLSEAVRNVYVYGDKKAVIYNDVEDRLFVYFFGKNTDNKLIAQEVNMIYGAMDNFVNQFSYKAQSVNLTKNCNRFLYCANDTIYYYQLGADERKIVNLGSNVNTKVEYIVDKDKVYKISDHILFGGEIKEDEALSYKEIAKLGAESNVIYDSDSKNVIFITDTGTLMAANNKNIMTITENAVDGTLQFVENMKGAFTYVSGQAQVYHKSVKSEAIKLGDADNAASNSEILYYKKLLYFVDSEKKLYACKENGSDLHVIGSADRIFLSNSKFGK